MKKFLVACATVCWLLRQVIIFIKLGRDVMGTTTETMTPMTQ